MWLEILSTIQSAHSVINVYFCMAFRLMKAVGNTLCCRRRCVRRYIWQDFKERRVAVGWTTDIRRSVVSVLLSQWLLITLDSLLLPQCLISVYLSLIQLLCQILSEIISWTWTHSASFLPAGVLLIILYTLLVMFVHVPRWPLLWKMWKYRGI